MYCDDGDDTYPEATRNFDLEMTSPIISLSKKSAVIPYKHTHTHTRTHAHSDVNADA